MGVEMLTPELRTSFWRTYDTGVTQQKFIAQLVIQDQTWMHNFDSESEQQSMQWNERIGQNCHFIVTA